MTAVLLATTLVGSTLVTSLPATAQSVGSEGESANVQWLRDVYADTLGRPAEEAGLDFWLGRLAGGGARTREDVVKSFVYSIEGSRVEVDRAYADILSRTPESGGAEFWTNYLRIHPVTVLRANLIASDEYFNRSGNNAGWLAAAYLEILDRPIDSSGASYWIGELTAGRTRWHVIASLYLSDEALGQRANDYALEILDRTMTPAEQTAAIALIRAEDERALRANLLASDEAFEPYLLAVGLIEADSPGGTP